MSFTDNTLVNTSIVNTTSVNTSIINSVNNTNDNNSIENVEGVEGVEIFLNNKYPTRMKDIFIEMGDEEEDYVYHTYRNTGFWKLAKFLCKTSYGLFNTNYIGDEMDCIVMNNKMIDDLQFDDNTNYIESFKHNYRNVKKVVINFSINNELPHEYTFVNSECHYILENLKIPNYNKQRTISYTDYFKSFIFSNVIPSSYNVSNDDKMLKINNIWIHHENMIINFTNDNGVFNYKFINI